MNTEEIIEGYMGSTEVNSIYQGSELIWPKFDYKYMIGGTFTSPKNKIMRLNNDGSIDNTWYNNNSYTGWIWQLIYDNINKKIYVASDKELDGGLFRLNMDGIKDTSFNIGSGFNSPVYDLNIDTINQKIYVAGGFTKFRGSTQNYLIRLHMDGSKDTNFNIGTGFDNTINSIIIDRINQKLYVGGYFSTYNYAPANRLIRLNLDGSVNAYFGTGFNSSVDNIKIDNTNSKIYVGGSFTMYNGSTQNRLIRLNMSGSKDTSFNIGTGFDGTVYALNIDNINQKIYVGGDFTTFNGSTQKGLVRLNYNGTKDTSFNIGTGFEREFDVGGIFGIDIDTINQKIYVGGNFIKYNNQQQKNIARLNMDGSLDTSFNIQLSSHARTIIKYKK